MKKRSLPENYKCNACGAMNDHAIYDCPSKSSKKSKDPEETLVDQTIEPTAPKELKKLKSLKIVTPVFISGLEFTCNKEKLTALLEENLCDGLVERNAIHLIKFEDNSSKCKGIAYVNFTSTDHAEKCVKALNGLECGKKTLKAEIDKKFLENLSQKPKKSSSSEGDSDKTSNKKNDKGCYRCGGQHDPATCDRPRICYRCGTTDHLSYDCPQRKYPNTKPLPASRLALQEGGGGEAEGVGSEGRGGRGGAGRGGRDGSGRGGRDGGRGGRGRGGGREGRGGGGGMRNNRMSREDMGEGGSSVPSSYSSSSFNHNKSSSNKKIKFDEEGNAKD